MPSELSGIDLNLLVALNALLRERSVTRAAAAVGLTQPAMSNQLKRLRRLFGDELFIRIGNTLEPTSRAEELEAPLRRALRIVEREVFRPQGFDAASSNRVFTVAASNATTITIVPALAAAMDEHGPQMHLRLLAPAIRETDALLRRPDVDLVLLPDVAPTSLPRERLYEERWVCIASPDNSAIGDVLTLDTLSRLPYVCYISQGMPTHPDLTLAALGALPSKRIEVEDFLVIPFLVQDSNRVAVLHEQVARQLEKAARIRIFPLPTPVAALGIDMVWNPRTEGDPACRWLRTLLLDIARGRSMRPLR